jgi:hypothetical protein
MSLSKFARANGIELTPAQEVIIDAYEAENYTCVSLPRRAGKKYALDIAKALREAYNAGGGVTDEEMDEFGLGEPLTDKEWMQRQGMNE